jgi:hypothetical protein
VLLVVLGLSFCALRLIGLDHGSPPIMYHADERHYAGVASRLSWSDLNPHRFENPPLLTYVLFAAREAHTLVQGDEDTRRWINQGGLYRLARILSALLGALTAFVVAATARRLAGDRAGFAALLVVGFSFLHGRDSHFGVNDVPMTALVAAVTWCSVRAAAGDGLRWAWLGAFAAGLAAATKYNGAVAVALPVAAVLLSRRRPRRLALVSLGLVALSLVGFLAANPFALLAWDEFSAGFTSQYVRWGDSLAWGQSREPLALLYGRAGLALLGGVHAVVAALGILVLASRCRRSAALVLLFPVLYLAGMLTKPLFFWRFVLPLLPALALLSALGWDWIVERLSGLRPGLQSGLQSGLRPRLLTAGLLLVGCAWPAAQLVRLDQLLSRTHTWMLARDWVLEHVPRGGRVFCEGIPPTFPEWWTQHVMSVHMLEIHEFQEPGDSWPAIERGGWVITSSWITRGGELEDDAAERAQFHADLNEHFKVVAEFSPGPQGDALPHVLDSLYAPLVDLWSVDRPGHTLRIHRVLPRRWVKDMLLPGATRTNADER